MLRNHSGPMLAMMLASVLADRYGITVTEVVREWIRTIDTYEPNAPRPPAKTKGRE